MENQHRKIKGYRELSAEEIDLMNRIKDKGAELLTLCGELERNLGRQSRRKHTEAFGGPHAHIHFPAHESDYTEAHLEFIRFKEAEPFRWAKIGKTDIQTGVMAMVRAVAQPAGGV